MAPFVPGTGGSLKSTTMEDALLELMVLIRNKEDEWEVSPRVFLTIDAGAQLATATATLPIVFALDASGSPELNTVEYIVEPTP